MENTHDYVEKLNDDRKKAERNRKHGQGNPEKHLPTKQHGTNK